jgi:hypothetical protein
VPDDLFDAPGGGDLFCWEDHYGRLLLITPHSVERDVQTKLYGKRDATRADIVVLAEPGTGPAEVIRDTLVFPLVIRSRLRSNVGTGRMVLGRLGKGDADGKGNPPWILTDPTDADKAVARAYIRGEPGPSSRPASATPAGPSVPPF